MTENTAWRWLLAGFVLLLVVTGAAMFFGAWLHPGGSGDLPPYPYAEGREISALPSEMMPAIGAYEAIRETLKRGSVEGVSAQARVIAETLSAADPRIASCAKRLGAEKDAESARRIFMRLHRLMERHARSLPQK